MDRSSHRRRYTQMQALSAGVPARRPPFSVIRPRQRVALTAVSGSSRPKRRGGGPRGSAGPTRPRRQRG